MNNRILATFCFIMILSSVTASATLLDFESLADLDPVTTQYSPQGIEFDNAIALTSGFSLNEFDFPPHSGTVAIGDNGISPLQIRFLQPSKDISGWFTYGAQLTISAYDSLNGLLGIVNSFGTSNLGTSTLINIGLNNVSRLSFVNSTIGNFIVDDLNFTKIEALPPKLPDPGSVPEPSTLILLCAGFFGLAYRKVKSSNGLNYSVFKNYSLGRAL